MIDINKLLDKLLQKYLPKFSTAIKIDYGIGSAISITNAKIDDKKTSMNPLSLTKKDQEANTEIIKELVKGVNDELAKKINYAVNKNITERGSNKDLEKDLQELFDKDSPNYFNYSKRFENIARTESTRILNTSAYNTAKRLGAKKKYLFNVMDNRTADDSKVSQSKYGSPEQAIDLDEEFVYTSNGKEYRFLLPPDRPRDRGMCLYLYE